MFAVECSNIKNILAEYEKIDIAVAKGIGYIKDFSSGRKK